MEIIDKMSQLAIDNVEVNIFHFKRCNWLVKFKGNADGIELQVQTEDVNFHTALEEALEKWERATRKGVPELASTLITYEAPPAAPLGDDVPF